MMLPTYASVLVAVDGGELTAVTTAYALRFPKESSLTFVCAVDPNGFLSDATAAIYGTEKERDAALEAAQRVVDACAADAQAAGLTATGYAVEAEPVNAIIDLAAKIHADVIVMASHARSGFARLVLGSVAEAVVKRANIPVLLVPNELAEDDSSRHLHQIFKGL
jgi:nucleotide-binding universal stress UspA family protein